MIANGNAIKPSMYVALAPRLFRSEGVNGVLYGAMNYGGKYGSGTIFAVTAAGTERVLYSFGSGPTA